MRKQVSDARSKLQSNLATLEESRTSVEKNAAEILKIDTDIARQQRQEIRAPHDGTILMLNTFADTVYVKEGDPLATLVPDTRERAVELYMNGNDIPLISAGREVRIQFEGWPALQFSGWPSVAVGTFGGEVALVDASDSENGKFRIVVRPLPGEQWPESQYLLQGARAKGWVLLDTVSLGFELWRQFNGFPPQLKDQPPKTESQDLIKIKTKI
ncbi:MAG: HlyD family efflux transporter periplasmic adaptor subunit [Candidatus Sericytochromatia bacterium]|nr:HlyD family efflux transporter periplasmic adaptor subunit [Candidatus Sericytochromatia bacterium]